VYESQELASCGRRRTSDWTRCLKRRRSWLPAQTFALGVNSGITHRRAEQLSFTSDQRIPTGYVSGVVSIRLSSEESWLLVARYGPASRLGALTIQADAEALVFDASERERLCAFLCTRDMTMGSVSQEIYLLSADGNVLVTWDHHT
jgi:hypothetical protein